MKIPWKIKRFQEFHFIESFRTNEKKCWTNPTFERYDGGETKGGEKTEMPLAVNGSLLGAEGGAVAGICQCMEMRKDLKKMVRREEGDLAEFTKLPLFFLLTKLPPN